MRGWQQRQDRRLAAAYKTEADWKVETTLVKEGASIRLGGNDSF